MGVAWNPSDCTPGKFSFSNGNLTIGKISAGLNICRGTISESSGKKCFEVQVDVTCTVQYISIGIATDAAALTSWLGSSSVGWGYDNGGYKGNAGAQTGYDGTYGTDLITVYVDLDSHTIGYKVNGDDKGTAFSNLPAGGSLYPTIYIYNGCQATLIAVTGSMSFMPAGYSVWGEGPTPSEFLWRPNRIPRSIYRR